MERIIVQAKFSWTTADSLDKVLVTRKDTGRTQNDETATVQTARLIKCCLHLLRPPRTHYVDRPYLLSLPSYLRRGDPVMVPFYGDGLRPEYTDR